jgi:hypothetical protein
MHAFCRQSPFSEQSSALLQDAATHASKGAVKKTAARILYCTAAAADLEFEFEFEFLVNLNLLNLDHSRYL